MTSVVNTKPGPEDKTDLKTVPVESVYSQYGACSVAPPVSSRMRTAQLFEVQLTGTNLFIPLFTIIMFVYIFINNIRSTRTNSVPLWFWSGTCSPLIHQHLRPSLVCGEQRYPQSSLSSQTQNVLQLSLGASVEGNWTSGS